MTQTQNTTKTSKGTHLTRDERIAIETLKNLTPPMSNRAIARQLERAPQTIHKEVKDGTVRQMKKQNGKIIYFERYSAEVGQRAYDEARKASHRRVMWLADTTFIEFADKLMLDTYAKHSPYAVIQLAKASNKIDNALIPCVSTLYHWIDAGFLKTKNMDLMVKMTLNTKKKRNRKNKTVLGKSIEERPESILTREEFGHWEIDTVRGLQTGDDACLLTIVERKTRFELAIKIDGKTSESVSKALKIVVDEFGKENFSKVFKTITSDNGTEFASLSEALDKVSEVFFTHPYSSYERGSNENGNRMLRRFFPKGVALSPVPAYAVKMAQDWMNSYPRKVLGGKNAHILMVHELHSLNVAEQFRPDLTTSLSQCA
jgi:IS30 family transposase